MRFLLLALGAVLILNAAPARADDDHGRRGAREHEWREREWREHYPYYRRYEPHVYEVPPPVYVPPPVVYAPPPPPIGLNFVFPIHIQ